MWRQMLVDPATVERIRRATWQVLLRSNALAMGFFVLLALASLALAASSGDWSFVPFPLVMLAITPVLLRRSAARIARTLTPGTFIAYAVTPDGTLHYSSAAGTVTVNPGHVGRIIAVRDCWMISLTFMTVMLVPHELIPDADAALLVRHLPAEQRALRRPTS